VEAFTAAWGVIKAGWPTIATSLYADMGTIFTWAGNWLELKIGQGFAHGAQISEKKALWEECYSGITRGVADYPLRPL
jgi:hypothetical protein